MGFHRRHIGNDTVHRLFNTGGAPSVFDWYTRGADALVTEMGLATKISNVINDKEWHQLGRYKIEDHIADLIREDLNVENILK